ncbi:hypothetical protein RclHR1_03960013 [Rhizophagus clarus]|uniref:Arrestin-like N-terminal domain-containing protein n=1 Tax=Rhizophagus clarus TaxID=94130 RepID=A0A2Z6S8R1_9GLOM|nr:hypothetical protein RclHR1_03960013 [Rhizophagus clarus]GES79638.1 hypothetical protein GLOIN_2v1773609 [Rhizophagus clarus]
MSPKIERSNEFDTVAPHSRYSKKIFFEYSPGETSFQLGYLGSDQSSIEGTLHLRYTDDKPIFAKKITLSFIGKEFVQFAGSLEEGQDIVDDDESEACYIEGSTNKAYDEEESMNDEEEPTNKISTYKAKREFFASEVTIWRSQSKGHYEAVKFLDLPFKFKLPDNLPPSVNMDKGCGRIYYMLKAVVSRRPIDPNSYTTKKMIKCVVPIVRYTITPEPKSIHWFKKEEGPAKQHVLDHDVSVARSIFGSGESIVIPIKLCFHESKIYLKKIFVGIKEYHELRTDKYETLTKRYIVDETVQADTIPISNGPDNECSVEVKLNIPHERNLVYDVDTTYITVSHKLKIKVCLGKAPDLHLSNFVKIEKLVSEEEVFPPTPPTIEVPREVVVAHEPIVVKRKQENTYRRLSPFFPLFDKLQNGKKRISLQFQPIQIRITDSENPNVVYNSRSLVVPQIQIKYLQQNKPRSLTQAF